VVLGHVWETASHPGQPPRGRELLAAVAAAVGIPVLAIGGVTPERVAAVRQEGAHGVAVIRGIWGAAHAGEAAARYLSAYDAHHRNSSPTG
jgi:thiamine monophosphate synthase